MGIKRYVTIPMIFILSASLGTADIVLSAGDSSKGISGWSAKFFGRDKDNWKKGKEADYKEKFKGELSIMDHLERIEFTENYVDIYDAELNGEPSVVFIGRTKSGKGLLDIIYEKTDMSKYYRFQKMDERGKKEFLVNSFAKYKVDMLSSGNKGLAEEDAKPEKLPAADEMQTGPGSVSVAPKEGLQAREPVALPAGQSTIEQKLITLNSLKDKGLISVEEYNTIRARILSEL